MRLPPFELHRPETLEEATALLVEHGDDAVVYAGGTELTLLLKLGLAAYGHLVDVKRIPALRRLEANGVLEIGGAVTHRELERSEAVRGGWPALAAMERGVANVRVRTAGTLGGNLAFSDPHSDPATFLLAANAEAVLRRGPESRTLPVSELVLGPYTTALRHGELIASIRVPAADEGAGLAHLKFSFHERPAATVACLARVADGAVAEARVAVGSVGVVPVRAPGAEAALLGLSAGEPDGGVLEAAGAAAAEAAAPVADANGSVEYKRNLVRVLVGRCFRQALAAAAT
jgi:carbon-monoxide dehydrogenase medium subunit